MQTDAPMTTPAAALAVRNLTVRYGSDGECRRGLDDVSFSLSAGEIIGVTGASGSGKSTLAHALLGLPPFPGRITAGEIQVGGRNLLTARADQQRSIRGGQIALIVQNPRASLDPLAPIGAQIERVIRIHHPSGVNPDSSATASQRAIDLLRLVGINDPQRRAFAFAHELSGGMAQRVLIAMALAGSPRVLVADEPTSGLDVTVQAQFLDLMWQKAKELHLALILITQEPGILANYCDRVLVMANGRIAGDQSVHAFFAQRTEFAAVPVVPAESGREQATAAKTITPHAIQVKGLVKEFPLARSRSVVHAVSDISFEVHVGETLGLVGESGSGKTTVGRCVLGLEIPTAGDVVFNGNSLQQQSARQLRRIRAHLQSVHQDPRESLDPRWSIAKSIAEPLQLHSNLDRQAASRRVSELLRAVGCSEEMAAMRPKDLGASELQRINVARALASRPQFIVLDEPTSQLEPQARLELTELLRRLQVETQVGLLFISHDLTTVSRICHRVAVMYLGQIVELAATSKLFASPLHPYTRALLSCHLRTDLARRRVDRLNPDGLSGEIPSPVDLPRGCYLASRCPQVQSRCREESQELREWTPGHWARCWRAGTV